MTLTEWLGIGGFILGVINSATHIYIQFLRKPKLDIEIIGPCQIVSNSTGRAELQANLRLKAINGPIFLREARLYHETINVSNLSIITPPTLTPQFAFETENGVNFSITHFLPLIDQELNAENKDLIRIWSENEKNFIDIRDLKIEKDDVKSFTVLASIHGPKTEFLIHEDFEVKGWKLILSYDKQKEIINISGLKLVKQYI